VGGGSIDGIDLPVIRGLGCNSGDVQGGLSVATEEDAECCRHDGTGN